MGSSNVSDSFSQGTHQHPSILTSGKSRGPRYPKGSQTRWSSSKPLPSSRHAGNERSNNKQANNKRLPNSGHACGKRACDEWCKLPGSGRHGGKSSAIRISSENMLLVQYPRTANGLVGEGPRNRYGITQRLRFLFRGYPADGPAPAASTPVRDPQH
jgi:hypothetical protein